ncbi:2-C-methyl-D-erythritol 2,4-cyclodiphosphate synthase [Pseudohongiella sp.]|uniref:2-C-methyl-D-erythritol 2,4-cyclodiphosphate synthase n=1 Tax=Pseudohongiella sp. TaxID=1979412 RepID=UPI00183B8345|nr:2-C-methyl-D-erythritol 2,4-cyclodiphosphate synthase [Pseudohongiella sp.]HDZ08515.1 2-C-methyl-D-erythritol 2,4-cyclodiphosphate synthase [Pseudohongiella sp.]HEA61747.1 2-C-methyl-D-erythritol 2,4-cyclodiphosphate synthase [Pseudohongiella sp.]
MRTGHGYDAHRFAEPDDQRALVLGGVTIPYERGLLAHSDGDALIHALCDAILGALGRGDIGRHFPDNDAAYKNVDSGLLLQQVVAMMTDSGWTLANADMTILAQAPKMAPHTPAMCKRLAELLNVDVERVNVKASTTEGMGFVGRREGIETHAVVVLYR